MQRSGLHSWASCVNSMHDKNLLVDVFDAVSAGHHADVGMCFPGQHMR